MNVAQLAEDALHRFGDRPTVWFEGRWWRSDELDAAARACAGGLRNLGVAPGDAVVVTMMNCPEVGVTYNAVWRCGGAVVPVLFLLSAAELAHILRDCGAVAVVTTPELLAKVREAAAEAPSLRHIVVAAGDAGEGTVAFADLAASAPLTETHDAGPGDVAVVLYTSGTTGRPKGVLLSHGALLAMAHNGRAALDLGDDNVSLACLPLSHSYGISASLQATLRRGTAVLMRWFDAGEALRLIEEFRVTVTAVVPAMMVALLDHPDALRRDLSSLRFVASGGAPLPVELQRTFEERFGCEVLQGYGLSESAGQCTVSRPGDRRPGSVGRPVPGVEVRVVDDAGAPLAAGELGEVVMRGPNLMLGYRGMPEETAAVLHDGWLRSGDIGYLDGDGFLHVVDRRKDLVIRGGFNILPRDVEEVLHAHPAVAQAAVVGVPDRRLGEQVRAYVALHPGAAASPEELLAHCRARLAAYKCPATVVLLPSLPVNATGKVLKRELRERAAAEVAAPGDNPPADALSGARAPAPPGD